MVLTKVEIEKALKKDLNNRKLSNSTIMRFIPRNDNKELGDIVKKIWDYAEKVNHHPDIFLTYSGIKISLFTHDEFGVTEKDINFARSLDKLY
jgi:4a-hydroxytetrahydrobiopterin dehydratase